MSARAADQDPRPGQQARTRSMVVVRGAIRDYSRIATLIRPTSPWSSKWPIPACARPETMAAVYGGGGIAVLLDHQPRRSPGRGLLRSDPGRIPVARGLQARPGHPGRHRRPAQSVRSRSTTSCPEPNAGRSFRSEHEKGRRESDGSTDTRFARAYHHYQISTSTARIPWMLLESGCESDDRSADARPIETVLVEPNLNWRTLQRAVQGWRLSKTRSDRRC